MLHCLCVRACVRACVLVWGVLVWGVGWGCLGLVFVHPYARLEQLQCVDIASGALPERERERERVCVCV